MISFWKFDFQIRLQIKRNVARVNNKAEFSDRDVDDAPDGYVACESYKDTHTWEHVANMERAMQVFWRKNCNFVSFSHLLSYLRFLKAVPLLVEGSSQTELKHPKNVYTQYEPRVFSSDEVATIWESNEMKKFLNKAENV